MCTCINAKKLQTGSDVCDWRKVRSSEYDFNDCDSELLSRGSLTLCRQLCRWRYVIYVQIIIAIITVTDS